MQKQSNQRMFAFTLIAIGVTVSIVAAVVPHYTTGYRLMFSVLLIGLLPYLAYGLAVPFLRGWLLALPGVILVVLHTAVVVRERFLDNADYSGGMIYFIPLALTLGMLPLIFLALKTPWGAEQPTKDTKISTDIEPS